jgi:hypothetical protein
MFGIGTLFPLAEIQNSLPPDPRQSPRGHPQCGNLSARSRTYQIQLNHLSLLEIMSSIRQFVGQKVALGPDEFMFRLYSASTMEVHVLYRRTSQRDHGSSKACLTTRACAEPRNHLISPTFLVKP